MYTFFEIKRNPVVGTVCQNPTSRYQSVVVGFQNWGDEKYVCIINEKGKCQKIEYYHFCERYAYRGESKQDFNNLFVPTKSSQGFSKTSFDVGDIVSFCGMKHVITRVFDKDTRKGVVKCAILVNENGNHSTKPMLQVSAATFVGKSKVRLKHMLNLKEETFKAVKKIMKKGG